MQPVSARGRGTCTRLFFRNCPIFVHGWTTRERVAPVSERVSRSDGPVFHLIWITIHFRSSTASHPFERNLFARVARSCPLRSSRGSCWGKLVHQEGDAAASRQQWPLSTGHCPRRQTAKWTQLAFDSYSRIVSVNFRWQRTGPVERGCDSIPLCTLVSVSS